MDDSRNESVTREKENTGHVGGKVDFFGSLRIYNEGEKTGERDRESEDA